MKTRMQGLIGLGLALMAASGAAAADKPVFGLVMSFSGWFQPIDADTIAGAKLAVDDINASGGLLGRKLELYLEDGATTDSVAAVAAAKLVRQVKIDVLFGGGRFDSTSSDDELSGK